MSKTIKQIAEELGVDKQKVYRYVKKHHINEVHHDAGVMHINEAVENAIKSRFLSETTSSKAHHEAHQSASNDAVNDALIDILKEELRRKNEMIDELRTENKELKDKLIELSGEVGASLKAITQSQLADKLIEGSQIQEEQEVVIDRDSDKKKPLFGFFKRKEKK